MILTMPNKIDLSELTMGEVFNLAGHDRGVAAREKFNLSQLDGQPEEVLVTFPKGFRGLSSSFFQGMFAASVQAMGSVQRFFEHYRFEAPEFLRNRLADYAEQVRLDT